MTAFQTHTPPATHTPATHPLAPHPPTTLPRPNSPFTDPGESDAAPPPETVFPGAFSPEHDDLARDVGRAFVAFLVAIVSAFQAIGRFTVDLGTMAAAGAAAGVLDGNCRQAPPTSHARLPTAEEIADGAQMGPPELGRRWHVVTTGTAIGIFDDW